MNALGTTACRVAIAAVVLVGLLAGPAWGQEDEFEEEDSSEEASPEDDEATAQALAMEALNVKDEHCADVAGGQAELAAQSIGAVSDVWGRISAHLGKSKKVYLLYWRGVLAQCLSQEERALEDLQNFLAEREDSSLYAQQVADAKKRISQISRRTGTRRSVSRARPPADPGPVLGVLLGGGLAAGAVASGIGAAVQWQAALAHAEALYPAKLSGETLETAYAQGQALATESGVLTGVAIGCGVGSALSFALTALASSSPGATAQIPPPVLVPTRSGAAVLWEARW